MSTVRYYNKHLYILFFDKSDVFLCVVLGVILTALYKYKP